MNNNVECIRDAIVGAVLGVVISVGILFLSIMKGSLLAVGGLFTGGASFEAMSGASFVAMMILLMMIGAIFGYGFGNYSTQDDTIKKKVKSWMSKHNK